MCSPWQGVKLCKKLSQSVQCKECIRAHDSTPTKRCIFSIFSFSAVLLKSYYGISLGRNWKKNTHNIDFLPSVFWNVVAIQALAFSTDCGDVPL